MKQSNKFLLFDGNNLAHIAFHRGKSIILKNKQEGEDDKEKRKLITLTPEDYPSVEGMMYLVFFRKLHKLIRKFSDYYFIFTWDNPGSSEWRRAIYSDYKIRRNYEVDPTWRILFDGIVKLREVLQAYPLSQVGIDKLEADDIMYSYAKHLSTTGKVVIISGDSDMIQAIQEFGVKVYHPIKDKYVVAPETYDYCLYKAIKGDTSDDIEGIFGYGEVKSARLAEAIEKDTIAIDKLNHDQQEIVSRNLRLIRIENNPNLNKAIPNLDAILASTSVDFQKIKKFYFDYKLKSLVEDFDSVVSLFA